MKTLKWKIGAVACALVLFAAVARGQSELRLNIWLQPQPPWCFRPFDPLETEARLQSARRLGALWQARTTRDVTSEVVPFLRDRSSAIQISALRILARLENSQAEAALRDFAGKNPLELTSMADVPPLKIHLALGQAQSRGLKGQARLDAYAAGIGLTWPEIGQLSAKINVPRADLWNTPGNTVVHESVDLLCLMARQGEVVMPLAAQLTLSPAQQIQVRAASLPPQQGADLIVDFLANLKIAGGDDALLYQWFVIEMKPVAATTLIAKLQAFAAGQVTYNTGFVDIFRALALTGDPRVPALLKEFKADDNSPARSDAMQALRSVESKTFYPLLP